MIDRCTDGICEAPLQETASLCPRCHGRGRKVKGLTVRYHVQGKFQSRVDESLSFRFCRSPECPVVYYSDEGNSLFTKDELSERVTTKEKDDPLPICYCFNFFRHDVGAEIRETGKTTIPEFISAQVKAGNCFCETTNPQGTCCLGNVSKVVREIQKGGKT